MKTAWSIEPILQKWRIQAVWPRLPKKGVHVDVGCDDPPVLLKKLEPYIEKGVGLDIVVKDKQLRKLQILHQDLQKKINLPSGFADSVTMLAVLEHVKYPAEIVTEIYRILKPGGVFLFTVPSPRLKYILPLLGNLGFVRKEMIDQHENYFTLVRLEKMLAKSGYVNVKVRHFALGFNTVGVAYKKG